MCVCFRYLNEIYNRVTDEDFWIQTMLAAIKMEVMTPPTESPDEGCIG